MKYVITAVILIYSIGANAQQNDTRVYSLGECIEIALENNLSVKLSELDNQNTEINLLQSRMDRLPNFNLGGGYGINWGRSIDPTTNDFINQRINFSSFGGSSSLTLFNGRVINNSIKRDELNAQAAQNNLERTRNTVAMDVTGLYLDVIFNRELEQNSQSQMAITQQQLDRTTKLVDAGGLPITNRLDLEAQLATNEVDLINAENRLSLSLLNLKQALQIPGDQPFDIVVPELELNATIEIVPSTNEIYLDALATLPEVRSADLNVESSIMGMRVAQGSLYPTLSLDGSLRTNFSNFANRARPIFEGTSVEEFEIGYLTNNPTQTVSRMEEVRKIVRIDDDFTFTEQFDENLSKSLSLNLQIPIFNKWRTRNSMQRARLTNEQAEINAEQTRNQVRQSIETARNNASAALKSFQASTRQVSALEQTFTNVENRYNLGVANFVDYQVASSNLFQARSDLTRAKYEYIFRLKILDFYQGKPLSIE
ncbi:MAG: TolC family protein [Bacteroidetes bacterium]|nr:TolC family protein [Bacteroidota bacterium]MDA1121135.1 TolC family protein [Bacteroidota bacterium]